MDNANLRRKKWSQMPESASASFTQRLDKAIQSCDRVSVIEVCDDLVKRLYSIDDIFPEREARSIVSMLRRAQLFEAAEKVADAIILSGIDTPSMRRLLAQTLLDQRKLSAVFVYLDYLREMPPDEEHESQ